MADEANGAADAIRAVVVLTDGKANQGQVFLSDVIRMMSRDEQRVQAFRGFMPDVVALLESGDRAPKSYINGTGLAFRTRFPVQIFFIGIGDDADLEVGRMLAEATGAEFQGTTESDLAAVLEEFSKYF